jgi:cytochrome c-type biogenesis protein CcmH/NrfG
MDDRMDQRLLTHKELAELHRDQAKALLEQVKAVEDRLRTRVGYGLSSAGIIGLALRPDILLNRANGNSAQIWGTDPKVVGSAVVVLCGITLICVLLLLLEYHRLPPSHMESVKLLYDNGNTEELNRLYYDQADRASSILERFFDPKAGHIQRINQYLGVIFGCVFTYLLLAGLVMLG